MLPTYKAISASVESRGKLMVTALERLAGIHALADVVDPAAWEREIRKDRLLPGRHERC